MMAGSLKENSEDYGIEQHYMFDPVDWKFFKIITPSKLSW
jgi:hypothetical protein